MASIRKRGSSYLIVVSMGYDYNGKRIKPQQKTVHPPEELTPRQVEKWLNEQAVLFERECRHTPQPVQQLTLAKYIDLWLTDIAPGKLAKSTIRRDRQDIERILPALGHYKLTELRPEHFRNFYAELRKVISPDTKKPLSEYTIEGDVAGICAPGQSSEGMEKRIDKFGLRDRFVYQGYPTTFWDVYQEGGHAVRATVSDMGPELLSRILGLTAVQEGILHIVFQIADDKGLLLIDLKDLRAMLTYVNEHRAEYMMTYGNITSQSVAAILRALLPLEQQGGELFFGEPALDIRDWMRTAADGRGMINVLDCVKLVQNPTLYASFLLWMLSELFEILPEAGDLDKPRMVFFFDEAHMLFRDAPAVLLQKVEQTVKLIRSRGVGVYFVTQSPSDIPDTVLAQLSNRVQHALRAYTPTELKAVRAAARAFRPNPAFQAEDAIMELGVGEALTSFLDEAGVPAMVERTKIICPQSLMSVPEPMVRAKVMMHDGMEKYDEFVDNVSAYEVLTAEREEVEAAKQEEADRKAREKEEAQAEKLRLKEEETERKRKQKLEDEARRKAERRAAKIESQLISAGGQVLKRGLLGVLKKW